MINITSLVIISLVFLSVVGVSMWASHRINDGDAPVQAQKENFDVESR
jgi:hypothetical protein